MRRAACFVLFSLLSTSACEKSPPEIVSENPKGGAGKPVVEPVKGPIALADAVAGVPGTGQLFADLETDKGKLTCKLFEDKAPKAVANFVGLARGLQPFQDPVSGSWVKRRAYDMAVFHRIIKGFMIQGGDPSGTGTGDPGYTFDDEKWGGAHDRAGLLCMANKGENTNGMQWFITDAAAPWLDSSYTIFGECAPLETVHAIASVPVMGEKPQVKPVVKTVTIYRQAAPAPAAGSAGPNASASAPASASASAKPSASASAKK
jgi:peptidyl-prolyl cis-trans isomerase A (cyclophilin A)